MLNHKLPIRVPSLLPGKWIYLRSWTNFHSFQERTWSNHAWRCNAVDTYGFVNLEALPEFNCKKSSIEENMLAIDEWFESLGAEEITSFDEWPDGCIGGSKIAREDRIPYGRNDDWNLLMDLLEKKAL